MNYRDDILTFMLALRLSIDFPPKKKQDVYVYKEKLLQIIRQILKLKNRGKPLHLVLEALAALEFLSSGKMEERRGEKGRERGKPVLLGFGSSSCVIIPIIWWYEK